MDIINLEDYDISYEIQFIALMMTVLEPYINFNLEKDKIYKKNDDSIGEEEMTKSDFIHFIQHTFPDMINHELEITKEHLEEEKIIKDVFMVYYRKNYHIGYRRDQFYSEKHKRYYKMFEIMSDEEMKKEIEYYQPEKITLSTPFQEKLDDLKNKINYLEKIRSINRQKNGKIKDVLQFLESLKYYQ